MLNLRSNAVDPDDATVVDVKRGPSTFTLQRQIKALKMRVSFLERAIRPAKKKASVEVLDKRRNSAEEDAVREALMEFYAQQEIEFYLRNPNVVELTLKREHQEAEFLRSRGLKPQPSRLPEQFQKGLKAYRPKASDSTDSTRRR